MKKITILCACLALSACALDATNDLASTEQASSIGWLDDVQIPNQQSARQPALAYFNGRTHMVHSGSSYPNELWWTTYDGTGWTTNVKIQGQTADGSPSLTAWNGALYMVYKPAGTNTLVLSTTTSGTSWSPPSVIYDGWWSGTVLPYVSLASVNGALYAATCEYDGASQDLVVLRYDGTQSWQEALRYSPYYGFTCAGVSLSSIQSKLHLIYNEHRSSATLLNELVLTPSGTSLLASSPQYLGMNSSRPASVAVCGDASNEVAYLVHSGDSTPSQIWWSTGWPGYWTANSLLTNQTSNGGAAVGCYGSRAIMVHNGGTNQLWWAWDAGS